MDETAEVVGGAHKKTSRQLEENGGGSLVGVAEAKLQSNGLDEDAPVGGAECSSIEGSQLDAVLRWADRRGKYERLLVWAWVAPVCLLAPCAYLNILLMVYIPSRSCSLPPSPSSFSHDQWRNFTTPRVGRRKVFVVLAVKVALLGSLYVFVRQMWVVLVVRCLVSTGLPVLYQIVIISG